MKFSPGHDPAWHGFKKPGAAVSPLFGHFRTSNKRWTHRPGACDNGSWPDRDCILTPAEWKELEHASTVAFSTCKFGPAIKALEAAIQRGLFQEISSPPVAVLRKVILAAHASAGMPPGAKKLLAQI